eukprot:7906238-Heterocapsa_arctica.AAC.1
MDDGHRWLPPLPPQRARSSTTDVWRFITYNCQRAGGGSRLRDLGHALRANVLALQSTGVKQEELGQKHVCERLQIPGYTVYQWPWRTDSRYSTETYGVSIALNRRRTRAVDVKQVIDPPENLAGRAGALRICHR